MANKTAPKTTAPQPAPRAPAARQAITFELVARITPTPSKADQMTAAFGLNPVSYSEIVSSTMAHVISIATGLEQNLNERALEIFLQRIVASFVSGAYGASQFYGNKRSDALALHSKLLNDDRDEDRLGVAGFESKAQRASMFAAELGLQAYAMLAAADGAVQAYEHVTGSVWKPYESAMPATPTTQTRSAEAQRAALAD